MNELDGSDLQVATHLALAKVAWSLDRDDAAPAIYAALAPFAEELAVTSTLAVASMGSVSRYLGQMATLMHDWPQVEVDFARAMRRNMETRARGEVAETRFDWATALLRHGQARDRERASAMLEAAARGAAELGMEPLRRRATNALAALMSGPSPLTSRELEVAALVAEGMTNKEVATRLRLSVRTAENHLLNVMNKLGLDNRAQVAAWYTRTRSTGNRPHTVITAPSSLGGPAGARSRHVPGTRRRNRRAASRRSRTRPRAQLRGTPALRGGVASRRGSRRDPEE